MNRRPYRRNYLRLPAVRSLNLNEQTSILRYFAVLPTFNTILRLYIGEVDSRTRLSREKEGSFEGRVGVRAKSRAVKSCVPAIRGSPGESP